MIVVNPSLLREQEATAGNYVPSAKMSVAVFFIMIFKRAAKYVDNFRVAGTHRGAHKSRGYTGVGDRI